MKKKWHRCWQSWLTIIFLLFVPTFLIGVILMWTIAPWSKRTKWWITGIGIGIPLFGIIISLLLVSIKPTSQLNVTYDTQRKADIQYIGNTLQQYYLDNNQAPASVHELQNKGYLKEMPQDPKSKTPYQFRLLDSTNVCVIEATLSTGEMFSRYCFNSPN